jgi:signal transduction histidine kinase
MIKKSGLVILILFFLSTKIVIGQQNLVDSLLIAIEKQQGLPLVQTYGELSWHYKNIDIDSAFLFAKRSLDLAESIKASDGLALAYNVLANAFEASSQNDSAFYYHDKSLAIKKLLLDSIGMANTYNNIGILYDLTNNYKASLDNYFKALNIYEKTDTLPFKVAMVCGNIGIVYKKMKEYGLVLEYYNNALNVYSKVGSEFGVTVTQGNMASVFMLQGNFKDCISYSEMAKLGYEKLGYPRYVPYTESNMAIAYDSLKQYNLAQELHFDAVRGHSKYKNDYELSNTYLALANNQYKKNRFENAVLYSDSASFYAQMVSSQEFLLSAIKQKSRALNKLGRYKESASLLDKYIALNDSLFETNKTKAILELQTQYDTEKKQQQIKLQKAEIAQKDLTIKYDKFLLTGLIIFIAFIIIIAFLIQNKLKWKQAKIIEETKAAAQRDQMAVVINSQEKERKRFAEDIHDGFGQLISVLKLNVSSLGKQPSGTNGLEQREKVYESSLGIINDMYAELRNICFNLMPQTLVKSGLEAALKEFADRINLSRKVQTRVLVYDLEVRLSDLLEISLYRIIQEVTNNILKYADATEITIQLVKDESELTLTVEDNGIGFDPEVLKSGKGNGWKNINARSNLINSEFHFESQQGRKGTTFILNIPLNDLKSFSPVNQQITQN